MRSGAERGQRGGDAEGCEVAVGVVHQEAGGEEDLGYAGHVICRSSNDTWQVSAACMPKWATTQSNPMPHACRSFNGYST